MTAQAAPDNPSVIYPYSIKISDTAKGIRLDVHVYALNQEDAIKESFETYVKARMVAIDNKIQLAPVEGNSK